MPVYEYRCDSCGLRREEVRPVITREIGPACECGVEMELVISRTSFSLSGEGWARDGYSKRGDG